MIKNIVFDLGNVLLTYRPYEYLQTKIHDEAKVKELHKEIFLSDEWAMLDRGTITEKKALDIIISRNPGNAKLIDYCMENWYDLLQPIEDTVRVVNMLKENGCKLYILSNIHKLSYEYVVKKYDFFKLFDGSTVSYEEKALKPEPGIYERLIQKYGIDPCETLFIDDMKDNIAKAEELGFKTVQFVDPITLKDKLYEYNIISI